MEDKIVIQLFVDKIKRGEITLEQVPIGWRDKVQEKLS